MLQFFILILALCFFIFLFCLYLLSRDDFIILRKDVALNRIFNTAFLAAISALFFARLFYGLFFSKNVLFDPFVFLLLPKYAGLSLMGGVLGGALFLLLLLKTKNMPIARLFDFFSISFLSALPLGLLGHLLLSSRGAISVLPVLVIVSYLVLLIVFLKIFLPLLLANKIREGTVGVLFLLSFSAISLLENFISRIKGFNFSLEDLILLLALLFSLAVLVGKEKLIQKLRR